MIRIVIGSLGVLLVGAGLVLAQKAERGFGLLSLPLLNGGAPAANGPPEEFTLGNAKPPPPPEPPPMLAPPAPIIPVGQEMAPVGEAMPAPAANPLTVTLADGQFKLIVFGALQGNLLFSTARPIAPGTPLLLAPGSPVGFDQDTVDVHARSSILGAIMSGPEVGNFQSGGLILVLFYNDNIILDRYGILPYEIWGDLKNDNWRFAAGLQRDIFNPVDPTMLTFGLLYGSGNAGNYRGQFRVERYLYPTADGQVSIQAGLSEPIATFVTNDLRLSEDNGWPNFEARVALGMGAVEGEGLMARRPFEVGLSGVVGQVRTTDPLTVYRVVADVWGVGLDAHWQFNCRFGVQGEVYSGQTLGTYNGGILQNVNSGNFLPIRTSGAWGEAFYYVRPDVHAHAGYGIDDPLDRDTGFGQALRNETYFGNVIWDVTQHFRVGFEVTWRETAYQNLIDNHGTTFHTQVQWTF